MSEEWFDVSYINFDEAILHGQYKAGKDAPVVAVRAILSGQQKQALEEMNFRHQQETQTLLRSMVA